MEHYLPSYRQIIRYCVKYPGNVESVAYITQPFILICYFNYITLSAMAMSYNNNATLIINLPLHRLLAIAYFY